MKRLIVLVFLLLMVASPAIAGGVVRPGGTVGPRALGMAGAYNAVANDGSAFYHNIAGLTQIKGNLIQLGADLLIPKFEFELPKSWGGFSENSESSLMLMPLIAGTTRLSDKLVLGIGLYAPYGLGVTYPKSRQHGLMYRESMLGLVNLTPAIAWQITDTLSVGVGLDIGYGQLTYHAPLHQIGDVVLDPLFLKTEGDGFGLGYRLGLLWQPNEKFSWGLSYSSPLKIKLRGKTKLSLFGLGLGSDDFKASLTFPGRIGAGISFKPTEKWLIALDANWYDYSNTKKIDFNFDFLPTIRQELNWQNNWSVHLGTEYQVAKNWRLRGGVAWLEPAVPKTTTNPVIPDGNGYCATIGVGWQKENWSVDLGYLYAWADQSVKPRFGHLAPGEYKAEIDVISMGFTYRF